MSTKNTVTFGPGFHLYEEVFDDSGLFLEMDNGTETEPNPAGPLDFECSPGRIVVRIPPPVLRAILQAAPKILDLLDENT